MLAGRYGRFNQAGDLAPRTGPYGTGLLRDMPEIPVDSHVLYARRGFNNFIGGIIITNVNSGAVVGSAGYGGAAPSALQPAIVRPLPWTPTAQPVTG